MKDCIPDIVDEFGLTDADVEEMLPSGRQPALYNRLHWARTYLGKAGLLVSERRGVFSLSPSGASLLASNPPRVDMKLLERFEPYQTWQERQREAMPEKTTPGEASPKIAASETVATPDDRIATAVMELESALADELLRNLLDGSPSFFERAVVDLLVAMGYGRGRDGAGKLLGKSGDGGIDGVINEDALGLDAVYVQAKRYAPENTVGRPAIQQFVGSLTGEGAAKGVFVTTSAFSREALSFVERVAQRIVLIDGQRLARLMIAHGVGVRPVRAITLRQIDENFFADD